ncbi:P-loop containing nucleoside triphosphate hydrolase protein [Chytriomyces sp. MP71]|nr:P-loop containing nucleoside triphosphate hydrolase protein [Chytriomyces sp. MP71]
MPASTEAGLPPLEDYRTGARIFLRDSKRGWSLFQLQKDARFDGSRSLELCVQSLDGGSPKEDQMVKLPLGTDRTFPPLKNPDFMDFVDDLSQLSYLHEPAVLHGIRNRYLQKQHIYTYSGMVLIAMNPFERLDIYSEEVIREYAGRKRADLKPHIYAIAEECFRAMLEGRNQSVVVSGESGAGKTQSTRYIMQYLAAVDSLAQLDPTTSSPKITPLSHQSETEQAVLASNPILETFGNAKTTRNDNSSRFGKFVQLFFSTSAPTGTVRIMGARVRTYLLERSRLIFQPPNERNYHIFYQLCAGSPPAERAALGLTQWESFQYLNQGNAGVIPHVSDAQEFKITQEALSKVGVAVSMQWELFRICAAILHIGNIHITSLRDASAIASDDPALVLCASLLGISRYNFVRWITQRQSVIRGEKFIKEVKMDVAIVARDSVAKVIYTHLFDWLVCIINKNLLRESEASSPFIGVLDIYGFEHFTTNSFEQFCINYANEKLQQEFNAHVFRIEQEGYISEGLEWTMIDFNDNKPCIELIEGKSGILSLLDEETRLQNGSDVNLVTKLHTYFVNPSQKFYAKPRFGTTDFMVKHYAVDVTYTSTGFIEKNKDTMSDELRDVLLATSNSFLRQLLTGLSPQPEGVIKMGKVTSMRTPTLGSVFKASLQELMQTIRQTQSHYIRCIKPNASKHPFEFDGVMVLSQLQACGVLETIKISNAGYPNKLEYQVFAYRYGLLVEAHARDSLSDRELCMKVVASVLEDPTKYQFGKTRVFLKSGQIAFFETLRKVRMRQLVVFIQKCAKRRVQREKFVRIRAASLIIQIAIRSFLARKSFMLQKRNFAATKIQSYVRGYLCRKAINTKCGKLASAIKIQTAWRTFTTRTAFKLKLERIILLQSCTRKHAAIKCLRTLREHHQNAISITSKAQLESKITSLSKTLVVKVDELATVKTKVGEYEAEISGWKDKFEAATTEISTLKREISILKTERDAYKEERDRFSAILTDCIQGGLLAPFGDFPFLPESEPSMTVTKFSLPESKRNSMWADRRESMLAPYRASLAPAMRSPTDLRESISSTLRTENETLKSMVESMRLVQHKASVYYPSPHRARSIYEEDDIVAEAERERKRNLLSRRITNRYSMLRKHSPTKVGEDVGSK